ncbi:MAG: hypothetical protein PVI30_09515 [Myxococcales bacterium]
MRGAAAGGPALRTAGARDGLRSLCGALAVPLTRIPNTTRVDPDRVHAMGYALSRRYLTAWLCELTGQRSPSSRRIEMDWEGALGVTLPALSSFPLPELSPDGYEIDRHYETRLVRLSPRVIFPQAGSVARAGQVEALVDVELRAVLTELRESGSDEPEVSWYDPPHAYDPNSGIHPGAHGDLHPPADAHLTPRMGAAALRKASLRGAAGVTARTAGISARALSAWAPPVAHPAGTVIDHTLATLARVRMRLRGDLHLGFNARGNMWLPELRLTVAAVQDQPLLGEETIDVAAETPLDSVPADAIAELVQAAARQEIQELMRPAVFTGSDAPRVSRALVPGELLLLGVSEEILNLATLRQAGGGDGLSYAVVGDLLYWPIELEETLTQHIA